MDEQHREQIGVFWFVSLSYVSRVNVAPSEQSHLKTRTQLKCAPNQTSTQTFFLLTEKSWKGVYW